MMHRPLSFAAAAIACLLPASQAGADFDTGGIRLPPGFTIEVYADVDNARSLALGEDGVVFVSNRQKDAIYALVPGPGKARVLEIDDGLATPNGIAFHNGDLYVAEIDRVLVYRGIMDALERPPKPEVLPLELPSERHHGWRYIGFGPDGKLYVAIGAPCNICDRAGFAEIVRMTPKGTGREVVARGVRNSVGFTWHPESGELWFTDNGRDMLGDEIPADELNRVTTTGEHFGYPFCHQGDLLDPTYGEGRDCAEFTPPVQKLGAHHAALGLAFYTGEMFPPEYRGQVFIAEHGSWNRSTKAGYRIALVRLDDGGAVSYEPFAEGWVEGQRTLGRPVDVIVAPDGALLVSDDHADKVYRISYREPSSAR